MHPFNHFTKWPRALKRVDFGFDISEDSPIRRPMRCRGAHQGATTREPPIGLEYRAYRPSPLRRHPPRLSSVIRRVPFVPKECCHRPLLAGSSLRFSRAPWLLSFLAVQGFEPATLLRCLHPLTTSPSGRARPLQVGEVVKGCKHLLGLMFTGGVPAGVASLLK